VILRIDRWGTELPPPSDPDPNGAAAVQELMGGRFGEMSTFMNYTFQSFNFRNKQGARPFYDLVANIAAEEFGHIELVAATINSMLTGASPISNGDGSIAGAMSGLKNARNTQQFIAGGHAALPQDSNGRPWTGDNVFASGDLIEDLTHNFFLETVARQNKLRVYEMVEHPAAKALTGYLLVRGGVHQIAYARAIENLTGADLSKLFPTPRIATEKIPECKAAHRARRPQAALPVLAARLPGDLRRLQRDPPGDRRGSRGGRRPAGGHAAERPASAADGVRPGLPSGGDRRDRGQAAHGRRAAQGADRPGERLGQRQGRRRKGEGQGHLEGQPNRGNARSTRVCRGIATLHSGKNSMARESRPRGPSDSPGRLIRDGYVQEQTESRVRLLCRVAERAGDRQTDVSRRILDNERETADSAPERGTVPRPGAPGGRRNRLRDTAISAPWPRSRRR
jgi:Mn-containing catalase